MEEEKKASKLDVLKDAITAFVNTDVNELRDATKKTEFLDHFKTILKADDSGVYSWLEKILPDMKKEADALGITTNAKEEFETEPEEEPTEAAEAETPAEEATEEEPTAEPTEETPADATATETATEGHQMTRGEFLVEIANNFID